MPSGACAILVKEDFLDAPLSTSCLLLDSLYVAVDTTRPERRSPTSSVLILHVRTAGNVASAPSTIPPHACSASDHVYMLLINSKPVHCQLDAWADSWYPYTAAFHHVSLCEAHALA